jgi:hypothetical protein
MTLPARSTSLLVAFYLLASAVAVTALGATTAYAECAWVIWRQTISGSGMKESWFPEGAVDSHRECEASANAKNSVQDRVKDAEQRDFERTGRVPLLSLNYSWLCLPDTVDPRGPKGN